MSVVQLGAHWLPLAQNPAFADVLFLAPLSQSPIVVTTADKSQNALSMALSNLTYSSAFYGHSQTTAISGTTLFGAAMTQFSGGTMWTTNSYDPNHFNFVAAWPAHLNVLKTAVDFTMEYHVKVASADNANSRGGFVMTGGSLGYALDANPNFPSGGYAKGMFSLYVDGADGNKLYYGQGAADAAGNRDIVNGGTMTSDVTHHIAIVRTLSATTPTLTMWKDGQQVAQIAQTRAMTGTPSFFTVGGVYNGSTPGPSYPFRGLLSNVRISLGALYTAPFTPPQAPYPLA